MKKFLICFLLLLFTLTTCAPIYETYIEKGDLKRLKDKKIVHIDTVKTGYDSGIMLHVRYKD